MFSSRLSAEQLEFRDTVRDFVENEVKPRALVSARLEPFVAVEDEGRKQCARELRHDDVRAAEVIALRVPLLADDRDVVPREAPLARERPGVDIRPGAAEQVPVPEQNSQVR